MLEPNKSAWRERHGLCATVTDCKTFCSCHGTGADCTVNSFNLVLQRANSSALCKCSKEFFLKILYYCDSPWLKHIFL